MDIHEVDPTAVLTKANMDSAGDRINAALAQPQTFVTVELDAVIAKGLFVAAERYLNADRYLDIKWDAGE